MIALSSACTSDIGFSGFSPLPLLGNIFPDLTCSISLATSGALVAAPGGMAPAARLRAFHPSCAFSHSVCEMGPVSSGARIGTFEAEVGIAVGLLGTGDSAGTDSPKPTPRAPNSGGETGPEALFAFGRFGISRDTKPDLGGFLLSSATVAATVAED